jgi:hypothetical protein
VEVRALTLAGMVGILRGMQKINHALAKMGVREAPLPNPGDVPRRAKPKYVKVAGESKAQRRMRRKAAGSVSRRRILDLEEV